MSCRLRGWRQLTVKMLAAVGFSLLAALPCAEVHAWSDHPLGAYPALEQLPEVRDARPVKVETLESFLEAEAQGIETLLAEEEGWMRQNLPGYPARPDALAFKAAASDKSMRVRFLEAMRYNPESKLPLYLEVLPGTDLTGRERLAWQELTFLKDVGRVTTTPYIAVKVGDTLTALEVAASGADEPDFGLDIGLFTDSKTEFGARFGFGALPFGNPVLEYATQAPFHMGLYHEAPIVYTLASFTKRTYPEIRIRQCLTLARFAFKTGHDYWGWRFTGWGLHYVQDLSQPYHSTLLPGVSVARMLWINTIAMAGAKKPRNNAVQRLTNRHLALENYQFHLLHQLYTDKKLDAPALMSFRDSKLDAGYGAFGASYVRGVLTKDADRLADPTDSALEKSCPARLVSDPAYLFEQTEPDINMVKVMEADPKKRAILDAQLTHLLTTFGAHSRNFVRAVKAAP